MFKRNLKDYPIQTHFTDRVKGEKGCVHSRPGRIPIQGLGNDKFPVPIQYIEQTESQFDE